MGSEIIEGGGVRRIAVGVISARDKDAPIGLVVQVPVLVELDGGGRVVGDVLGLGVEVQVELQEVGGLLVGVFVANRCLRGPRIFLNVSKDKKTGYNRGVGLKFGIFRLEIGIFKPKIGIFKLKPTV